MKSHDDHFQKQILLLKLCMRIYDGGLPINKLYLTASLQSTRDNTYNQTNFYKKFESIYSEVRAERMSDLVNKNAVEYAQMARLREEAEKMHKDRGQSARDRLLNKLRDTKSTENTANSRYAQLLTNNQKALSGRVKRLSPSGKASGAFSSTPEHQGALKKGAASPRSAKKGARDPRPDLHLTQQQRSINNLRQNLMHPKQVHQQRGGLRRNEAGSQQLMRQHCLEEQIMDLEDDAHSGTLDHEKAQGKRNRSRNQQLEVRADRPQDPKLEPRSVQIELLHAGQAAHASVGHIKTKTRMQGKTQQPLVSSIKSLNSPGSSRTAAIAGPKQVPSSNIFQLGSKNSKSKATPKTAFSDADQFGHKSQPSNSSLSWQPQTNLKAPAAEGQRKKLPSGQVQSNYFVQKREQEPLKDPANKTKARNAASSQAQRQRMPSETPEDAERVSTTSGNMFDETRNNGLNKAAIQDSSQHTQHLSTQGAGQLHFIHTPLSLEPHDLLQPNRAKELNPHPYGVPGGSTFPQADLTGEQGPPLHALAPSSRQQSLTPGRASSKFSASSLCNRLLPQGSAIQYLVNEIRTENCDLCHLQRGLREIDKILSKQGMLVDSPRPGAPIRKQTNDWHKQKQQPRPQVLGLGHQSAATGRLQKKHGEILSLGKRNPDTGKKQDGGKYSDRSEIEPRALKGSIAQAPVSLSTSKFMIHEVLCQKYLECDDYFNCKLTSDIMYNETRHIVSVFKDYLIYDDFSEYMKRYYRHDESVERLPRIFSFYAKYSKVYPNYVALPRESRFMFKNIERKQKLIDQRNRRIQEYQEKKAAAERGLKEVEGMLGDRLGEGPQGAKFNLFNSEFVNNLTELACQQEATMNNELEEDGAREPAGYAGPPGSHQASANKFQVYRASAAQASRDQTERSAVALESCGNRLSQLLLDISLVSRADRVGPGRSQVLMSGATSRALYSQVQNHNGGRVDTFEQHDLKRQEGVAAATVPSISCSFISNRPSMTQPHGSARYSAVEDARARQMQAAHVAVGFDLNATSGDSLKQHFKNDENLAEITSIQYTEGNENKRHNEGEDDEAEFAVPSEKNEDQGEVSSNFDTRRQAVKNQGLGGRRDSQVSAGSPSGAPATMVPTARGSLGMKSPSDKRSSARRQDSQPRVGQSGRSQQEEPFHLKTAKTSPGSGQASKNQRLLKQAQRASMLKHAVQEVERDSKQRHAIDYNLMQARPPELESEAVSDDGIDDEFERNVGQSEDFQNFLNKYMQQKQRQAEKKVRDNFLELEPCEYGPSPAISQQEQVGGSVSKGPASQQRSKSGDRTSLVRSSSLKRRSSKQTTQAAGLALPEGIQPLHPLRSASDANLMKDASTGQLLRKLNSNFVPMEKIYGAGTLTKNRKTMSTPKYRPLDKQKLSRAGSRSSRAEDRLAQLGFPKYHSVKTASQRQANKAAEQEADEDEELPSVDDEYQGLGRNIRERQHQNYEALQRDVSARKVLPTADSPGNRASRSSQNQAQKDQRQQQRLVNSAYTGVGHEGESRPQRVHRSGNREQPQSHQKQKKPSDLHPLGATESQRNFKDPLQTSNKNDAHVPTIAQMKLISGHAGKSSFRQTKPSSSRKLKRPDSPGASKNTASGAQGKQREKISVYPTQRAQPMKGTADAGAQLAKRPQGSLYASSEIYLNTERPATQKPATEKSVHSLPRKGPGRAAQAVATSKVPEKPAGLGAFGPRAGREPQQPAKTVKTDRASSANLKIPGGSINIRVEATVPNEYVAADAYKTPKGETNAQPKDKGPGRQWSKGATSSPYHVPTIQKKRGSAAAALGNYRPTSLTDSARGSSASSGPGVYAKMIRAQAQTNQTAKSRAAASSSTSARATYTARSKQPTAPGRAGSRPDSINSQKDKNQFRTKSGSLGAASLLSPSLLQGQQQTPLPSQKPSARPGDPKPQRTSSRGASGPSLNNAKKMPMKTIASSKAHAAMAQPSKRNVKKQTIFSVNTSEQR